MRYFPRVLVSALLTALLSVGFATAALAHGGPGITITPPSAMPGDTVKVTASAISSPGGDVTITIVGMTSTVTLPMQKASDDGDFEGDVTIPTTLAPGTYQLTVAGDKGSLTGDLDISATAGATQQATLTLPARERPLPEIIGLVALFGLLAGAGIFFARTANSRARPN